jgi:hypothetical protein
MMNMIHEQGGPSAASFLNDPLPATPSVVILEFRFTPLATQNHRNPLPKTGQYGKNLKLNR